MTFALFPAIVTYAYTLSGCPGGLPDNREVTCEQALKVKPGLYVTGDRLVLPLNRKFCWGDQEKVFLMQSGDALVLGVPLQRVPGRVELWSARFTIGGQIVNARAEGTPSGKKFGFAVAITGFHRPVVSWDLEKQSLVVAEWSQGLPFDMEGTGEWKRAVSIGAIEAFLTPRRHHFDVTSVEMVEEKERVGVRFTTTSRELLIPADIRMGAPSIQMKKGHFFTYWNAAQYIPSMTTPRQPHVDIFQSGKLEVTFMRAGCKFDRVKGGGIRGVILPQTLVEDLPAPPGVFREDQCAVVFYLCATDEPVVEVEQSTLTLWIPVGEPPGRCLTPTPETIRRTSRPHL